MDDFVFSARFKVLTTKKQQQPVLDIPCKEEE
jgi:hypothetical protein